MAPSTTEHQCFYRIHIHPMTFHIQPVKEFLVSPALPKSLERLDELAHNLLWAWDPNIRMLFRRLDGGLWREVNHNPVALLGRLSPEALQKAAGDPRYVALYRRALERYDAYMRHSFKPNPDGESMLVAYFSMEYGLSEALPIYSGGLGILSGDHLRSASDAGVPLIAVGHLYQTGYLVQHLNPDGWQTERYPVNDFYTWPVRPVQTESGEDLLVKVRLPSGDTFIKVWQMNVGRVKLFLLDTNIPQNTDPTNRDVSGQLYGGDVHTRIRQEIVLGIGGLRALRAMGYQPTVFHLNEGHSAFLTLERIREVMKASGLTFEEALNATRTNSVFTTHTSVPAGIDLFDPGLMHEYFHEYCAESGIGIEDLIALGRSNPHDGHERFSMAVLAINNSSYRNAVSRLHREVSQSMWQHLWPKIPVWEVPITSVTNGVHLPMWLNSDLSTLYDQYLQPDWVDRHAEPATWELVQDIPEQELWEAHRRRKRRLVAFVRERLVERATGRRAASAEVRKLSESLDPDVFTIGFARRFATYKRATLFFKDIARLRRLVNDPDRPVQILIAGKAHPKDHPGKALIREIVQMTRDPELFGKVIFIEDYDIRVGRELVQGVDLWLNNPRRGEEACGTSGMKACLNGNLNLSILDGWWDEAYEQSGGWAIGDREPYSSDQDELHAATIYSLLENEIVPMYYQEREQGMPVAWMQRVKQCLRSLSPKFNCLRMIGQYRTELYEPAHRAALQVRENNYQRARERAEWCRQVAHAWDRVRFVEIGPGPERSVISGSPIPMRAVVALGGLSADDVRVEAVVGRVSPGGDLEDTTVLTLPPVETNGDVVIFETGFQPHQTGRLGYSLRVSPNHYEDPLTRSCRTLIKWSLE